MLGKKHLHITADDVVADLLTKSLKTAAGGTIKVDVDNETAVRIDVEKDNNNKINVDLVQPKLFRTPEDETGLFDKLTTAKEFAQMLTDNGLTLSFLRRGKQAISLGKEAKPTFSRVVTRSDDIQLNSVRESAKLKRDMKAD
jgi:endoglucanase Acf2